MEVGDGVIAEDVTLEEEQVVVRAALAGERVVAEAAAEGVGAIVAGESIVIE